MLEMAQSKNPTQRSNFLRLGADLAEPGFVLMFNQALGAEMYRKIILDVDGKFAYTTSPVTVALDSTLWRVWDLKQNATYIAYDPTTTELNQWWESFRKIVGGQIAKHLPHLTGRLIFFRPYDNLSCSEEELRRELINFAVTRFQQKTSYKFSWCDK